MASVTGQHKVLRWLARKLLPQAITARNRKERREKVAVIERNKR